VNKKHREDVDKKIKHKIAEDLNPAYDISQMS